MYTQPQPHAAWPSQRCCCYSPLGVNLLPGLPCPPWHRHHPLDAPRMPSTAQSQISTRAFQIIGFHSLEDVIHAIVLKGSKGLTPDPLVLPIHSATESPSDPPPLPGISLLIQISVLSHLNQPPVYHLLQVLPLVSVLPATQGIF